MAEKDVEENVKGNKVEAEGISTPEAEARTPEDASKVSPKEEKVEEKPTLTQTAHEALVHMATSEAGRLKTEAETERDVVKTEAAKLKAELKESMSVRIKRGKEIKELKKKLKITQTHDLVWITRDEMKKVSHLLEEQE